jgi:hypothetical protein
MAGMSDPGRCAGGSKRWWVAAVALLLIAAGSFTVGLRGHQSVLAGPVLPWVAPSGVIGGSQVAPPPAAGDDLPAPPPAAGDRVPAPPPAAGDGVPEPSEAVGPVVERSVPVSLRVPAIGLAVSMSELGLNSDGTVEVPTDFQEPGWFRLGPSPGQVGSAVILGHVDSYRGPAVFFQLRSLQAGDRVEVSLADGAVAEFVVNTVATYPKAQFPAEQVYASHGYSALNLVTCGGEFDSQTRSYLSNVVAYTSLVAITPADAAVGSLAKDYLG